MDDLWSHWAAGELRFQRCDGCGTVQHPPGAACFRCHSRSMSVSAVSGRAEVVSWSAVHRAPAAEFADALPYTILLVRLAEQGLVEVRADAIDPTHEWAVGQTVELGLGEIAGRTLPVITALAH